jgi:uncharacterized damage-inducible protein DinB
MPEQTLTQFWKYNNWANDVLFAAFDNYGDQVPASCLRLLSHIVNGQSVWLSRMVGEKAAVGLWDEYDLAGIRSLHEQTSKGLGAIIEAHAADLSVKMEYTNSRGMTFQNTFFDMLFQVFNHGTYHRAQIAKDMRQQGLEPVNTDYINFVR